MNSNDLFNTRDILAEQGVRQLFETVEAAKDEILIKQGDSGTDLYIVESGQYVVTDDEGGGRILDSLGKGSVFGEMAFLGGGKRSATVSANRNGYLLKLLRVPFVEFLRENPEPGTKFLVFLERLIVGRLRKADALRRLISKDSDLKGRRELKKLRLDIMAPSKQPLLTAKDPLLSEMCHWIYARDGQVLFHMGARTTDLFVIRKGKIVVVDDSSEEIILGHFGVNDVIGERSFLDGNPRASTARVEGSGEILMLSRDTLAALLERQTGMAINLILGLGTLLARRLVMANRTLRLLPDEELGEKAEVSRLLSEMRKSLHIKPIC